MPTNRASITCLHTHTCVKNTRYCIKYLNSMASTAVTIGAISVKIPGIANSVYMHKAVNKSKLTRS